MDNINISSNCLAMSEILTTDEHGWTQIGSNGIVGDFYADILVEDLVIIELKVLKSISPEHEAQLINYLKATGKKVEPAD